MAVRLEIGWHPDLTDAEGEAVRRQAREYFGLDLTAVRVLRVLMLDLDLPEATWRPSAPTSSPTPPPRYPAFSPWPGTLTGPSGWASSPGCGTRPGPWPWKPSRPSWGGRCLAGPRSIPPSSFSFPAITSPRPMPPAGPRTPGQRHGPGIPGLFPPDWDPGIGVGIILPRVELAHTPTVEAFEIASAGGPAGTEPPTPPGPPGCRPAHHPGLLSAPGGPGPAGRGGFGAPTDVELEYLAQARSDHCNHNTFRGCSTTGIRPTANLHPGQPLQDLHRGPHPGDCLEQALGGVGAVGQCRGGAVRRRIFLCHQGGDPQFPLQPGGLWRFPHRHRRGLPRPHGHRQRGPAHRRDLRLLRGPPGLCRAFETAAPPPAPAGRRHRRRQGRRQQERRAHRQRRPLFR